MARTILAVFAHPDDETFLAGPILAKWSAMGMRVELVTATPAVPPRSIDTDIATTEASRLNSSKDDHQATTQLADRRVQSLLCASSIIGVSRVHLLGYAESPMLPAAGDPRAGARAGGPLPMHRPLKRAALAEIAKEIREILGSVRPEVVLIDSPYGAYGHPDHIVVHLAAEMAFKDWQATSAAAVSRLYALSFPMPLVRLNVWIMKRRGLQTKRLGVDGDIDLEQAVRSASPTVRSVATGRFVRVRKLAARCYEKEIVEAPLPLRLLERSPTFIHRLLFFRQGLSRVWPTTGTEPAELFAGLAETPDHPRADVRSDS